MFQYVSILINVQIIQSYFIQIYIPICFYFNACGDYPPFLPIPFTFQYVSILIVANRPVQACIPAFTFQYVSILICVNVVTSAAIIIYIPICFYFNKYQYEEQPVTYKFTFQYVSILIHFKYKSKSGSEKFTFQYVSILMVSLPSGLKGLLHIYIPICFYFN